MYVKALVPSMANLWKGALCQQPIRHYLTDWIQYICRTKTALQLTQHNHRSVCHTNAIQCLNFSVLCQKYSVKAGKVTDFAHVHVLHYSEWCVGLCLGGGMRSEPFSLS